jgi:hypothetical protein
LTPHRLYISCLPAAEMTHARTLDPVTHLTVWFTKINLSFFARNSITRPYPHSKVNALQLEPEKKTRCDFRSRDSRRKMLLPAQKDLSGAFSCMGKRLESPCTRTTSSSEFRKEGDKSPEVKIKIWALKTTRVAQR